MFFLIVTLVSVDTRLEKIYNSIAEGVFLQGNHNPRLLGIRRSNILMAMASLDKYGKRLREYEGTGLLTLSDGQTCSCSVRAIQIANGRIIAACEFDDNLDVMSSCYNSDTRINSIKVTTGDDFELLIEGNIFWTDFNHQWKPYENRIAMVIWAGSMRYGKRALDTLTSARFGITNFEFFGNKFTPHEGGGGARDVLAVNLGEKIVEIHEIPDHKNVMDFVKAQQRVDVTCEAVIEVSSTNDLKKATGYMDALCKPLSFARGTKINWVYCDCYNGDKKDLTFHKNSIVWQYTALPIIDPRNPNDTANFVTQAYPAYLSKKDEYGLDIAIESYLDSKRESGYLETRALRAVVVLEFLRSRYAEQKGDEFILKDRQFRKMQRAIKTVLDEQRSLMSLPQGIIEQMASKIGELNRPSFRTSLEMMLIELGVNVSQTELDRFIKIRNSLVHRGSFLTTESWKEYSSIFAILDRVFLRILSYEGEFLDITNEFARIRANVVTTPPAL